jgi:hypothetical protein
MPDKPDHEDEWRVATSLAEQEAMVKAAAMLRDEHGLLHDDGDEPEFCPVCRPRSRRPDGERPIVWPVGAVPVKDER